VKAMKVNEIKPYIGKRCNIHLKDGSVIVNVKVIGTRGKNPNKYLAYTDNSKKVKRVMLNKVSWLREVLIL
jgi:hypothetical protein